MALLAMVLLACEFLPGLPPYLGIVSSRAIGMIGAASIAMLIMGVAYAYAVKARNLTLLDTPARGLIIVTGCAAAIIVHGIIVSRFEPLDVRRFSVSLVPLVFMLGAASAVGSALRHASTEQIDSALWIAFWSFAAVIALRAFGLEPLGTAYSHPMFPFSETSEFALAFGPVYLYRTVRAQGPSQYLWLVFGLAAAVLLRSATLMVFAAGAAMLCRRLLLAFALSAIPIAAGAAVHLTYFTSRADISSHSSSISALVYLQGWEFVYHYLYKSDGLGLGFQQLGVHPPSLAISVLIKTLNNGKYLNTMDGSFLFSKLASEGGILGIAIGCAYLLGCWREIRRVRSGSVLSHDLFASCVLIGFGVDMFIRAPGYFFGQPLLFLGALWSLSSPKTAAASRWTVHIT